MKRYEQGSVGMRPDPEGSWCDYEEARAEIERLRGLLREAPKHSMTANLKRRVREALGDE